MTKGKKQPGSSSSSDSESPETSHPRERQSPRTASAKQAAAAEKQEKALMDELQRQSDNDNFWLTIST